MNGIERTFNLLNRKPLDRFPVTESFWSETIPKWQKEGHMPQGSNPEEHFDYDIVANWAFNLQADINFTNEVIEETQKTILVKDGNGALLRSFKDHTTTPETVDFTIKTRADWEEKIKPLLTANVDRIANNLGKTMIRNKEQNRAFFFSTVNVFECIHPLIGHENLLMSMALDPEWIKDMCDTYSTLINDLIALAIEKYGKPFGIWFFDDMGYKLSPMFSVPMYKELIKPYHKKTVDFIHSLNMPVILHSCGFVEPFLPDIIDVGFDALQALEVKAGMDLVKLYKEYGDEISFIGGMDIRVLNTNNKELIDKELFSKIEFLKTKYAYGLHSDHSIPSSVEYETYKYFIDKGRELGTY